MIVETEFYNTGLYEAGYKTVATATEIAEAFLNEQTVLIHFEPSNSAVSILTDCYIMMVAYIPPHEDTTHTPAIEKKATLVFSHLNGSFYDYNNYPQMAKILYCTIDANDKLVFQIYID